MKIKFQHFLHKIFDLKTKVGRKFDSIIIASVILSIIVVMLESIEEIRNKIGAELIVMEWGFTLIFTLEYIMRIKTAPKKRKYIVSFFGIIDLIAILPTYLSLFITGIASPLVIRSVRIIRVFRAFKLVWFLREGDMLLIALKASWRKILVFFIISATFAIVAGTLMFLIEGKENGFNSIPHSIYWAIVTLTTVGYGDISPHTSLGQFIASIIMIVGYGLIAVPTGVVAAEMVFSKKEIANIIKKKCSKCGKNEHEATANFCQTCGTSLQNLPTSDKKTKTEQQRGV